MKWTLEKLKEEALKYKTSKDFRKNSWNAYASAQRMGVLDQVTSGLTNTYTMWTLEALKKEANKYLNRVDFSNHSYSAYQAAWRTEHFEEICSHMSESATKAYIFAELKEEALKYTSRVEFSQGSPKHYYASHTRKDYDLIVCHMEPSKRTPWSDDKLKVEAKKYKTKTEFSKNSYGAYQAAVNRSDSFFNEICGHMDKIYVVWTKEMLYLEASKYLYRMDFIRGNYAAYQASVKRGEVFLSSVCSHMKPSKNTSFAERKILGIVKTFFKDVKKIRDLKVKIKGKPHIHGFDIDIFVPELNRGIEYDGTRFHSFEFMRKDPKKSKWSDDDIRNYHDLKDDWFETKGIKILHIKEDDWKKDSEKCIRDCLEFLGVS